MTLTPLAAEVLDLASLVWQGTGLPCPHWTLERAESALREALTESADVPLALQSTKYTCGPAAAKAVLERYGIHVSEASLAHRLGTDPEHGTRPPALVALFRDEGLTVQEGHGLTLADLARWTDRDIPVVACCQLHGGGHYVTITDAGPWGVEVMDPVEGPRAILARDWLPIWWDTDSEGRPYRRYGIAVGPPAGDG